MWMRSGIDNELQGKLKFDVRCCAQMAVAYLKGRMPADFQK
jgi:hypothetical protein